MTGLHFRLVDVLVLALALALVGALQFLVYRTKLDAASASSAITKHCRGFDAAHLGATWWAGPGDRPDDLRLHLADANFVLEDDEAGMTADQPELIADDLAPGDVASQAFNWLGLRIARIRAANDPLFPAAYRRLWNEFGAHGGMEAEAVIRARLAWNPRRPITGYSFRYELLVVLRGDALVAVRDYTVIVPGAPRPTVAGDAVLVHLSHMLVEPPLRGSGLSGWLRAIPIQTARECAAAAGAPGGPRITLVAEMEHPDGVTPGVMARLRSYERAGFAKIDPTRVCYCQPDFRAADVIDRTAVRPLPFALIVRRVGRETEGWISSAEVRALPGIPHQGVQPAGMLAKRPDSVQGCAAPITVMPLVMPMPTLAG